MSTIPESSTLERASAVALLVPLTCQRSVVNCEMKSKCLACMPRRVSVKIGLKGVGERLRSFVPPRSSESGGWPSKRLAAPCQRYCTFFLLAATCEKSRLWEPSGR